ncbi:MAG TPA: hypothetical protein VEF04_13795, partial [Blastocatellia bacterium]|nr:hypothetical protein [Blastocatellia bacterium]
MLKTPSGSGGVFLKTANSHTALLRPAPASQQQSQRAATTTPATVGAIATTTNANGMVTAPSMGNLVIKTKLEPMAEETANEAVTPTTPLTPGSDKS